jgi:hypothetical protein
MPHYLVAIQQPDGPPPAHIGQIMAEMVRVNDAMRAAGVLTFTAGLTPASSATVVRPRGRDTLLTDGPYLEGTEHIGGIAILDVPDLDAALGWAKRIAVASTLPVEVRAFGHGG